MCSKKSDDYSEESLQSFIDAEGVSGESCQSSVNSDNFDGERSMNVSSQDEEECSESESSSIPQDCRKRCNEHGSERSVVKNLRLKKSELSKASKKRVNYESVSSLSVSSSPENTRSSSTEFVHGKVSSSENHDTHHHRLSAFHSNHGIGGSSVNINHAEILSKMEHELREKGFQVDLNSNHHIFMDCNKSRHETGVPDEKKAKIMSQVTSKSKLSFGIDRILSDENSSPDVIQRHATKKEFDDDSTPTSDEPSYYHISKTSPNSDQHVSIRHNNLSLHQHQHHHRHPHFHHAAANPLALARCTECYFLGRYCRNNGNLPYSPLLVNSSPGAVGVNGAATGGGPNAGVPASFSHPWMSSSIYENSPLLSPSAYHPSSGLPATYGLNASNFSTMSSLVGCSSVSGGGRRKRSWSRAVFSSLQRKGLEKRFQIQKYITKPDRRQLAATLNLTDAQVKVWFQNRRMKWRHSKEGKVTSGIGDGISSTSSSTIAVSATATDKK